ncbi:MAG TPA: glucosamine-6-phosphate deaminase [bacterium]|nr:glucosamine-6-phosphate deaminase [bacterium]
MQVVDPIRSLHVDELAVYIYRNREEMAGAAVVRAAQALQAGIAARGEARAVFASAPSQIEFLHGLGEVQQLEWNRVTAFHLDEYLHLPSDAPQAFGQFLREHLFDRVRPSRVWFLDGNARDISAEIDRYERLLREAPPDLACVGVGENGHLAFNEPDSADFDDPSLLRVVALSPRSRLQQVHDGCFDALDAVPTEAITLTVPAIMTARTIVCVVPGPTKREALQRMLRGPVSASCPASILRRHPDAALYADLEAAPAL